MNEVKIYLKASGSIAELFKDFNLYQDGYQNSWISIYVPKSILYKSEGADFVNAVKTGAILTAANGTKITTKSFYANYVKDETVNKEEYAVYGQPLPKEYVACIGTQEVITNVVNLDISDKDNPRVMSVITSQVAPLLVLESAYLSEDEIIPPTDLEEINARLNRIEEKMQNKVLVDFTVDSVTGKGMKYYTDGTSAEVQFPTGDGEAVSVTDFLHIIEFTENSFTSESDGSYSLAFGSAQTGYTDKNYFVALTRTGAETYEAGEETVPTEKQGEYTVCDTVFKGNDGSLYMTATEPYAGRLLLISGAVFSQKVVKNITYANSVFTVTFTDGTTAVLNISEKLNKIDSDINRLYSTTPNNPNNSIAYTDQPNGGTIVQRTLDGRGKFSAGIENNDAATYGQTMELLDGIELVKTGDLQYQLTVNGKSAGTIDIPKDQFLKSVSFDPETNVLTFVFSTSDGDVTTEIDLTGLIDTYTAGDGLNLVNGQFSVKLDGSANNALVLTPNGLFVDKTQFESAADATEKWEQQAQVNAGKLDKNSGMLGNTQVYGVNAQGEQVMLQTTNGMDVMPAANSIPRYNGGGYLVSLDINEETAGPNTLTPKGYVDGIKEDIDEQLSVVPRAAANNTPTSGESVTVPNTPATFLRAQDYGTIFTHKRLWDGNLYDEGFNQILNPEDYPATTTTNGITFTNNGDGTITANGTPTETPAIFVLASNTWNGKYLLQGCPSGGTMGTYALVKGNTLSTYDTGNGVIANLTETTSSNISIYIWDTVSNLVFKPQLIDLTAFGNATGKTINTVDDWNALYPDFYPYVPTISPETPLEIVPSGNKSNVVSSGKNLFNCHGDVALVNNATISNITPSSFRINNLGVSINPYISWKLPDDLKYKTVTFSGSWEAVGDASQGRIVLYWGTDNSLINWEAEVNSSGKKTTILLEPPTPNAVLYIICYCAVSVVGEVGDYVDYTNVQLEIGDTATPYVPYVAPVTTDLNYTAVTPAEQSLIDNAVTLGDSVSERNGNMVTVRTKKLVLNGTEAFVKRTDVKNTVYQVTVSDQNNSNLSICNSYPVFVGNVGDMPNYSMRMSFYNNELLLQFCNNDYADVGSFKSYLAAQYAAGTPVTVYYALSTPETVEIEEITPIPTFGNNDTTFTSTAVGTSNAPVELDLTTYIAKNLPKGYSLLKDKDGNLIVSYTQTNMLYDVNTDKYLSDLLNLKDTATGTVYKITVTNGAITLVALPAETEETI